MKIAIITNNRPHIGGVNSYINNLTEGLRQIGHQIDIITPFGISDKFKIIKKESFKKLDAFLKNRGLITLILIYLSEILIFIQTLKALLKNKYDFLYLTNVTVANAIRPLEKILKLKVILNPISTLAGELLSQDKIKENSWVAKKIIKKEKKAYNKARVIIAISKYLADYFNSQITNSHPIYIVPCSYNNKIFYLDTEAKLEIRKKFNIKDEFVILFVGRMVREKGPFEALAIFKKLITNEKNLFLIFVGDGPLKEKLINQAKKEGVESKVKILGFIPNEELRKIYNAADVLIMPSLTHKIKEGRGTVPQEAMACGLPVIASACGGLIDTIQSGINGLLVEEKDISGFTEAILKIKNNPDFRQKIINQGFKDLENYYQPQIVAQKIIEIYQKTF